MAREASVAASGCETGSDLEIPRFVDILTP